MNNLKTIQEFSRRLENIQGQQDVFQESRTKRVLIANSRTILGAQGRLATLHHAHALMMTTGVTETFALCLLYHFHWP